MKHIISIEDRSKGGMRIALKAKLEFELWKLDWMDGKITPTTKQVKKIKRALREIHGDKCCECGWATVHPTTGIIPVEMDHINGNPEDNSFINLRLLCPNCHSLTPTFRRLNQGKGRKDRYNKE